MNSWIVSIHSRQFRMLIMPIRVSKFAFISPCMIEFTYLIWEFPFRVCVCGPLSRQSLYLHSSPLPNRLVLQRKPPQSFIWQSSPLLTLVPLRMQALPVLPITSCIICQGFKYSMAAKVEIPQLDQKTNFYVASQDGVQSWPKWNWRMPRFKKCLEDGASKDEKSIITRPWHKSICIY